MITTITPLTRLMRELPEQIDAALIVSPTGRRYFAGLASSAGTLLVTRDGAHLIVDFRYFERAKKLDERFTVIEQRDLPAQVAGLLKLHRAGRVGIETDGMTVSELSVWRRALDGFSIDTGDALTDLIHSYRSVKSPHELALMQQAQDITDRCFREILNFIRPGVTERAVANQLARLMRDFGADGEAFDTIALCGENASMPHGVPENRPLSSGELFTVDFGAKKDGYCSDMTRTVALGPIDDEKRTVYETVLAAQKKALSVIVPGVRCADVDRAAREVIDAAGYRGCFGHALGHSLGMDIHETPCFSPKSDAIARPGNVLSVEPGIYIENRFGCRIEDVVCLTEDGFVNLTKSPKELITL